MPTNLDGKAVTASVRNYERLLAIYPARFRREYGQEMTQLFRDQCRDAWTGAGGWGLVAMWLRVLPDLAKTALVEHFSNLRQREPVFLKMARALRSDPRPRAAFIRVFALVFIPAIMGSAIVAHWLPRVYSSTVRIEVAKDNSDPSSDPNFLIAQQKVIESYSILTNVIVVLNLDRKLPEQLGLPRWTVDETFAYLGKMVAVKQSDKTGLVEITVKNRSAKLAAEIANCIADAYKNSRLDQWRQIHTTGVVAFKSHLIAQEEQLREMQSKLDEMRARLGVPESDRQATNTATVESLALEGWANGELMAKTDYLEYSNILFMLDQVPRDKLGAQLQVAFRNLSDSELAEKSASLATAKDLFNSAKAHYAADNPKYEGALQVFQQAQQAYESKVESILSHVRDRVDEDCKYLQVIRQREDEIKTRKENRDSMFRPYYVLKDEIENLRYNNRESERYLNKVIDEVRHPNFGIIVVRDPGRVSLKPVSPTWWTIIAWMIGGTLLALVTGVAAGCLTAATRRTPERPSAAP